jgi:nucleoside-triphosphatase
MKNILITALPKVGKTTLIKEVVNESRIKVFGFYTEEIKEKDRRVGFKIKNFQDEEGILAHKKIESNYKVGSYKVLEVDLINIGVKEIYRGIKEEGLIVIDEIGKMECLFKEFRDAVIKALESNSRVFGSIALKDNRFTKMIKERDDTLIIELNRENYKKVKENLLNWIKEKNI